MGELRIERAYDPPQPAHGYRVLVDRLWPRGLSRERAQLDEWLKEIAPSTALRTWFNHDPARFIEFRARYSAELDDNPAIDHVQQLIATHERVTLLFAARDPVVNHAVVLRDFLAPPAEPAAGDAACWLDRVCPECGAINEQPVGASCWRCGALPPTENND